MLPRTPICSNSESKENLELDHWLSLDTEPEWPTSLPHHSALGKSSSGCEDITIKEKTSVCSWYLVSFDA